MQTRAGVHVYLQPFCDQTYGSLWLLIVCVVKVKDARGLSRCVGPCCGVIPAVLQAKKQSYTWLVYWLETTSCDSPVAIWL